MTISSGASVAVSSSFAIAGAYNDDIGSDVDQGSVSAFVNSAAAPFDFDGDGKTDIGIFRPTGAEWWINRSSNGTTSAVSVWGEYRPSGAGRLYGRRQG